MLLSPLSLGLSLITESQTDVRLETCRQKPDQNGIIMYFYLLIISLELCCESLLTGLRAQGEYFVRHREFTLIRGT